MIFSQLGSRRDLRCNTMESRARSAELLVGHYVLSKLGMVNGRRSVPISKNGSISQGAGVLHAISAGYIENSPGFPEFVGRFERRPLPSSTAPAGISSDAGVP